MQKFIATYGDVIVIVAVFIMLIAMVTPVGNLVLEGVQSFIQKFTNQAQNIQLPGETLESVANFIKIRL